MKEFFENLDDGLFSTGRKFVSWITGNGWRDPTEDGYSSSENPGVVDNPSTSSPTKSEANKAASDVIANANNTSADKSAQTANQQTSDWFKEAMKYNEDQARLDREFQQSSANKAMQFEAQEAQKLRDWQETLSNTQYQRAVADLKKAGLNPILVAQHLSGASTPSGSSASGSRASGSRASISQSSATKAEVDLNSRARILEAYLRSETSLKQSEIQGISNLLSALIGLAR